MTTCDRCQHYSAYGGRLTAWGECDVNYDPAAGYYAVTAVSASHSCDRWTARLPAGEIPAGPNNAPFLVTEMPE